MNFSSNQALGYAYFVFKICWIWTIFLDRHNVMPVSWSYINIWSGFVKKKGVHPSFLGFCVFFVSLGHFCFVFESDFESDFDFKSDLESKYDFEFDFQSNFESDLESECCFPFRQSYFIKLFDAGLQCKFIRTLYIYTILEFSSYWTWIT